MVFSEYSRYHVDTISSMHFPGWAKWAVSICITINKIQVGVVLIYMYIAVDQIQVGAVSICITIDKIQVRTASISITVDKTHVGVVSICITTDSSRMELYQYTILLRHINMHYHLSFFLFDLILYVPSTIFQLYRDGSSWVEPLLS